MSNTINTVNRAATDPTVVRVGKTTTYRNLKARDSKRFGRRYAGDVAVGNHARVVAGESITIWGCQTRRTSGLAPYRKTFKVGEFAVYDSWNKTYTGRIVAIGPKTVTIDASSTGSGRKQLSIHEFSWRNWDYNAEEIARRNSEWMD